MFSPHEEYILPNERLLKVIRSYLEDKDSVAEEILLSISDEPILEVQDEDRKFISETMDYWEKGYAIPLSALEELKRIHTGNPSVDAFKEDFLITLFGEEIEVEPDVNLEFAYDFIMHIRSREILDIASGFGWIPPLFSKKGRVLALDNSYTNRIIYGEDGRLTIEGTSIEIFPSWSEAKEYVMQNREQFQQYKDFAKLFWASHGASMGNITLLQGDATNMGRCLDLSKGGEYTIGENSIKTITCFFGLNHIGNAWTEVLEEIYRVLAPGGEALITIYREYLEKFPVKFSYDWTAQLKIGIIGIRYLEKKSTELGFKIKHIDGHRGEKLFYFLSLQKPLR
jgi:SAM-dependent methyltransferase